MGTTPTPPNPYNKKQRQSPEMRLQAECYKEAWNKYPEVRRLLFHVANELNQSGDNVVQGAMRRAEGIVKGVADLILLIPRGGYHGLMIEMKTLDGYQRKEQREWQVLVEAQGYRYEVIRTKEAFMDLLAEYLGQK